MPKKRKLSKKFIPQASIVSDELYLPNHSGDLSAGKVHRTPIEDLDPVNKKYLDDKKVESFPTIFNAGSVIFSNGSNLAEDNFNLYWDNATKELQPHHLKIVSDGSQASPALKFNDTNTGFYKSGDSINLSINNSTKMTVLDNGNVGIGTDSPGAKMEINGTSGTAISIFTPWTIGEYGQLRFDNTAGSGYASSIRSYIPGGSTSGLQFFTSTGRTEAVKMTILGNGNVGIGTATPTTKLSVNEKSGMTPIGGFAVKLTNKTGANSIAGQLLRVDPDVDDAVEIARANEDLSIGVFLDSGVSDGSEAWVVIDGIADVAFDDNVGATRAHIIESSEVGYVDGHSTIIGLADHNQQVGHCLESVGAGGEGTHILARCKLGFN